MIRLILGAGGADAPCEACGTLGFPRAWSFRPAPDTREIVVCVRCLAGAIDEATGWSVRNNVEQGLNARAVKLARLAARVPKKRGRPFKVQPS